MCALSIVVLVMGMLAIGFIGLIDPAWGLGFLGLMILMAILGALEGIGRGSLSFNPDETGNEKTTYVFSGKISDKEE